MKEKILNIIGCFITLLFCLIPAWLIQLNISDLKKINIEQQNLIVEEVVYLKYDTVHRTNISDSYEIFALEYEKPFYISAITQSKLDKKFLNNLVSGDKIIIKYKLSNYKDYDFEICEILYNNEYLLTFNSYLSINKLHFKAGICIWSTFILVGITTITIVMIKTFKKSSRK